MKFQKVSEKNLSEVYTFSKLYGSDKSFSYFKNKYKRNSGLFVACYKGKILVGACWGFVKGKEIILSHIAVNAKYWKKGIGKKLLQFWEKQAKATGKKKISLGAATGPINVVGFYEKSGYTQIRKKKDYIVMEKKL